MAKQGLWVIGIDYLEHSGMEGLNFIKQLN